MGRDITVNALRDSLRALTVISRPIINYNYWPTGLGLVLVLGLGLGLVVYSHLRKLFKIRNFKGLSQMTIDN